MSAVAEQIARSFATDLLTVQALRAVARPRAEMCGLYFLFDGDELVYVGRSVVALARLYDHTRTKTFSHFLTWPCTDAESLVLESRYIHECAPRYNVSKSGRPLGVIPAANMTEHSVRVRALPRQQRVEMATEMAADESLTAVEISRRCAIDQATAQALRKGARQHDRRTPLQLAVDHQQRTGCTPQAAAKRYGLAVSTVRRALARAGVAPQPVGRPVRAA